jgi:hypothetical protein
LSVVQLPHPPEAAEAQHQDQSAVLLAVPMCVDRGPVIDHHGVIVNVGRWVDFAIIQQPVPGLLALGEIADDDATRGYGSRYWP